MKTLPLMLASLVIAIMHSGCSTVSETPSCCAKPEESARPVSDQSLFQIDSTWTNDRGVDLKLGALGGRPLVVTMFFAKCDYACPVLVHDMKKVQAGLPDELRSKAGFVLVTFDSERDTPAALAEYRKNHELPENWSLLRGSPDDVLELAALLGVKFKKDARGQFAHSNILTVLNSGGEVTHQQIGLNQSPDETVKQLVRLLHP